MKRWAIRTKDGKYVNVRGRLGPLADGAPVEGEEVMLRAMLHWRRGWWWRLDRERRVAVVMVLLEAALVLFVVGAALGWWGR